jgi:hypothetical protein
MLKTFSSRMREFFLAGIDWVMATGRPQQGVNAFLTTGGGTDTDVIVFADLDPPLPDMASGDYVVVITGETTPVVMSVDESTKTPVGFTILGGGTEVINVVCVGRLEGMPAE